MKLLPIVKFLILKLLKFAIFLLSYRVNFQESVIEVPEIGSGTQATLGQQGLGPTPEASWNLSGSASRLMPCTNDQTALSCSSSEQ